MRRYERGTDGTWHDGLLMDLLAHELDRRTLPGEGMSTPGGRRLHRDLPGVVLGPTR